MRLKDIERAVNKANVAVFRREQIGRFRRVEDYLRQNMWDGESPLGYWKNKLNGEEIPYRWWHLKPPKRLFVKAYNPAEVFSNLNARLAVAFAGTTQPVPDARKALLLMAKVIAKEYGGFTISGGALGTDELTHDATLQSGGQTIAVLGNPVQYGCHPYEVRRQWLEYGILQFGGAIVSEYSAYAAGLRARLPRAIQRQRIMSALSDLFVVVQCTENRSTIDNAKRAYWQGTPVLVINWDGIKKKVHEPDSSGNNQLISLAEKYGLQSITVWPPKGKEVKDITEITPFFREYLSGLAPPLTVKKESYKLPKRGILLASDSLDGMLL